MALNKFVPLYILTLFLLFAMPSFYHCLTIVMRCGAILTRDWLIEFKNYKIARIITQSSYDVRSCDILHQLKWDRMEQRHIKHKAIMMLKTMYHKVPIYLRRQFSKVCESNPYHLRGNNSKLILPLPKTENLKKSFKYSRAAL